MNQKDLPPLALLPAFEAAGRLCSFKAAASELHVTPSAISQQIKALEDALGVALFERRGRAVALSQEGEEYLRDVKQLLVDLGSATRRLKRRTDQHVLRVSTMDFVAYEFLIPRLPLFRERFPGVELRIETSSGLVDFEANDFDAALRLGGALLPGLSVTLLGQLTATPVCTPALARTIRDAPPAASGVHDHPLIELRGQEHRGWTALVKAQGVKKRVSLLTLETYFETVRAAEQGLGVAFGVFPITTDWVTQGRLAVPLSIRASLAGGAMWLYRASDPRPVLPQIGEWLREQFQTLPELPSGRIVRGDPQRRSSSNRANAARTLSQRRTGSHAKKRS
jgi:LysR family glycine cleavage system transcriptional activator